MLLHENARAGHFYVKMNTSIKIVTKNHSKHSKKGMWLPIKTKAKPIYIIVDGFSAQQKNLLHSLPSAARREPS